MNRRSIQSMAFDQLSFGYPGGGLIFEDVSFELPSSKAVWIRSPGGRGKSTLLRLLAGLISPQSGKYLINGEAVNDMSFEEFLLYRMSIGYGFDMGGLINTKSLYENLIFPLLYHKLIPQDQAADRVRDMVEMFGMGHSVDLRPFAVSGSQRKLTCVLRSFVHWPQIILLDDPMTGLKQDHISDLIYYIEESFSARGLKQLFFTGESPLLANHFKADELLISVDWFTARMVA